MTEDQKTENYPNRERVWTELMGHQMVSTIRNACTCGAGDMTLGLDSGEAIRQHRRHMSDVVFTLMAQAWDECVDEAEGRGWMHDYAADDMHGRNPYLDGWTCLSIPPGNADG